MPAQQRDARITIVVAEDDNYLAALYLRGGVLVAQAYGDTRDAARAHLVATLPEQSASRIRELESLIARIREAAARQWTPPRFPTHRRVGKHTRRHLARSARASQR